VVGLLDAEFTPDKKPANVSEADWKKSRMATEAMAYRTLGWVAMQRKDFAAAEKAFTQTLQVNPEQGEVSYWLGQVILYQKKAERQVDALFHFARAATYTGAGALSPQGRQQVEAYLAKAYRTYHGDESGLKEIHDLAKTNVFPPQGFTIKSAAEIDAEKREALAKADPALALWVNIKENLTEQGGDKYFAESMKDALIPPDSMVPFKATVISHDPAKNPKTVVLGIQDPQKADVTLKLEEPLTGVAPAGTVIQFRGAPESFTKEPFMVTFQVEKDNLKGWPAPPPPAKKAPKKAAPKK
jgi:tetratricopeptide (TPR) repeat protein